ncbi:MAG TPA: biotin/lipoyl-containing protein [Candidatus Eisenbacteria bacterium]|nr:biotin/lipoyl-containing protein [Candidatus Eisenbacteria bacterium]
MKYEVLLAGKTTVVELVRQDGAWKITLDGNPVDADAAEVAPNTFSVLLNGESHQIRIAPRPDGTLTLHTGLAEYHAEVTDPRIWRGRRHGVLEAQGRQHIVAPMPGKVIRLLVKQGDVVKAGQGLLVVEAMKMQNEIRSPKSGKIEKLFAIEGQAVNAGEVLLSVE